MKAWLAPLFSSQPEPLVAGSALTRVDTPQLAACSRSDNGLQEGPVKSRCCLGDIGACVEARAGKIAFSARYHRLPKRVGDDYELSSTVLGEGCNGQVKLATSRHNKYGEKFAVKSFSIEGLSEGQLEQLREEVENQLVLEHPHIVQLVDVYEADQEICMIMECLGGGEVFERLRKKTRFSQDEARDALRQMLLALNYMHGHGVVHRDVKLQNFVYDQDGSRLKMIDFGFSKKWSPDSEENMDRCVGTISHVAPEVLAKNYTSQCDLWSLGVVAFMMLAGEMPFHGTDIEQMQAINEGRFVMDPDIWKTISPGAQCFVSDLLKVDPAVRFTAEQALAHPWMARGNVYEHGEVGQVVTSIQHFSGTSIVARSCMRMLACSLPAQERSKIGDYFLSIDRSKMGNISLQDLKQVLTDGAHATDSGQVFNVFAALDYNHEDVVHYSDLLAAIVGMSIDLEGSVAASAFRRLDEDGLGYITVDNLCNMIGDLDGETEAIFAHEIDRNNTGCVNFQDFVAYLRSSGYGLQEKASHAIKPVKKPTLGTMVVSCYGYSRRVWEEANEVGRFALALAL